MTEILRRHRLLLHCCCLVNKGGMSIHHFQNRLPKSSPVTLAGRWYVQGAVRGKRAVVAGHCRRASNNINRASVIRVAGSVELEDGVRHSDLNGGGHSDRTAAAIAVERFLSARTKGAV